MCAVRYRTIHQASRSGVHHDVGAPPARACARAVLRCAAPRMNDAVFTHAARLHEAGHLAEAARLYSDIIRANPAHFDALYRLGLIHLHSGRSGDAERLLAAAIRVQPRVPEGYYVHGCALQSLD